MHLCSAGLQSGCRVGLLAHTRSLPAWTQAFYQSGTSASFIDQRPGRRDGELWRPVHPFKRIAPLAWRSMFFLGILAAACVCCNAQDSAGKSKFRIVFDNLSDSGVDIFSMDQLGGEVKPPDLRSHEPFSRMVSRRAANRIPRDVPAGPREDSLNLKNFSFTLDRAQLSVAPHHNLLLMPMNGAEPRKIASLGPDVTGIAWLRMLMDCLALVESEKSESLRDPGKED